jgi:hypothetical protein
MRIPGIIVFIASARQPCLQSKIFISSHHGKGCTEIQYNSATLISKIPTVLAKAARFEPRKLLHFDDYKFMQETDAYTHRHFCSWSPAVQLLTTTRRTPAHDCCDF